MPSFPRFRSCACLAALALVALAACEGRGASREASAADRSPGASQVGARRPKGERKRERKGDRTDDSEGRRAATAPANGDQARAAPADSVVTLRLADPLATPERSAAAVSAVAPEVVYTINDAGHDAHLFAFDTTGATRGRWAIRGARNRDWEALAVGPCGGREAAPPSSCVYVGDVGDNEKTRTSVQVYRIQEPLGVSAAARGPLTATAISVRYPDGAHNVEAMYVAPDGAIVLITKLTGRVSGNEGARARLYRVPPSAWTSGTVTTATLADSLPEFQGGGRRRMVTDAARSPDGRWLAVRTYAWVATFPLDPVSGLPRRGVAPALCDLGALAEPQGEGIGFLGSGGRRLVLTSEGAQEPLRLASCPIPRR